MAVEIERKFLVKSNVWNNFKQGNGSRIIQGYIFKSDKKSVRVRIKDNRGYITLKGAISNISRHEFEYEIPLNEAQELLESFCDKKIDKIRFTVPFANQIWEVDEFITPRAGLILAEIELTSENETFEFPEWIDKEVTGQPEYYNSNMV